MPKKKDAFEEIKCVIEKTWPKTKKELEKGIVKAKKILNQGEKYLKKASERGVVKTKKFSLGLKKEKLYYDLGKAVARTKSESWSGNKKIESLLRQIKYLDRQITKIK